MCRTTASGQKSGKPNISVRVCVTAVLPNIRRLQTACRSGGIGIMYSVIDNMTRDGRDRSLDSKISSIDVQCGSQEAQVLDEIASADDEMIFRKTSNSVSSRPPMQWWPRLRL